LEVLGTSGRFYDNPESSWKFWDISDGSLRFWKGTGCAGVVQVVLESFRSFWDVLRCCGRPSEILEGSGKFQKSEKRI
jgi:hypothetical protein